MAQKNRTTLKSYFNTGDKPTEQQFGDLIDSCFNLEDDVELLPQRSLLKSMITSLNEGDNLIDPQIMTGSVIADVVVWEIEEAETIRKIMVDVRLEHNRKFTLNTPVAINSVIINTFYYISQ